MLRLSNRGLIQPLLNGHGINKLESRSRAALNRVACRKVFSLAQKQKRNSS